MSDAPNEIWVFGNEVLATEPGGFRTGCAVKYVHADLAERWHRALKEIADNSPIAGSTCVEIAEEALGDE